MLELVQTWSMRLRRVLRRSEDAQRLAPLLRGRVQIFLRNKNTAVNSHNGKSIRFSILQVQSTLYGVRNALQSLGEDLPFSYPLLETCRPFDEDG
jgi:hypothetical protein